MNQKNLHLYSWAKRTRMFNSIKNNKPMWTESMMERNAAMFNEYDSSIDRYGVQPVSFVYRNRKGKLVRYTPDQIVRSGGKYKYREIKPYELTLKPEFIEKWSHVAAHVYAKYGVEMELFTERDFGAGLIIPNMNLLYGYKRVSLKPISGLNLIKAFGRSCSFGDVIDYIAARKLSSSLPYALLAQGFFKTELTLQLNHNSDLLVGALRVN